MNKVTELALREMSMRQRPWPVKYRRGALQFDHLVYGAEPLFRSSEMVIGCYVREPYAAWLRGCTRWCSRIREREMIQVPYERSKKNISMDVIDIRRACYYLATSIQLWCVHWREVPSLDGNSKVYELMYRSPASMDKIHRLRCSRNDTVAVPHEVCCSTIHANVGRASECLPIIADNPLAGTSHVLIAGFGRDRLTTFLRDLVSATFSPIVI